MSTSDKLSNKKKGQSRNAGTTGQMHVDENTNNKEIDPYTVKVYKALPQLSPKTSKSFSGRFLQKKKRDNSVSVPGISSLIPNDPKSAHREFKYTSNYDI